MSKFPIVEVSWGDAWVDTGDYTFEEAQKAPATITGRDLKDKGDAFNKFLKKDKKVKTNKRTRK